VRMQPHKGLPYTVHARAPTQSPVMAVAVEGAPVRGHTLVPAKVHTCAATCWCHGAGRRAARIGRELRSRTVPPASESLNRLLVTVRAVTGSPNRVLYIELDDNKT
jgi:hypothetical protein